VQPENTKAEEGVLKIFYYAATGAAIAAREIGRKDGIILVKHPAFTRMKDNQAGFHFDPLSFVECEFSLYKEACLGETLMPEILVPFYKKYELERDRSSK